MNTQKFLVSGIAGGIVAFLLGYLIYGLLLVDFFTHNAGTATGLMRANNEMVWWALILGNLLFGLLYSYVFNKWANIHTMGSGAGAGLVLGLLMAAATDFTMYATTNISTITGTLVDILCGGVMAAIVGAVVGWMNGMGKKSA